MGHIGVEGVEMDYAEFFRMAAGLPQPYDYQRRLAVEDWPDLLDIPTGLGKTAAVVMAWLWKRGWRQDTRKEAPDSNTPRRLVWSLPMRVLVEQTGDNVERWLRELGILGQAGEGKVSVHVLMGGESDLKSWAEHPEEDMILIGTQDMLLSRALMRGYGVSRYQWPIHFALLHNDAFWVFDEVQLMGAALATSTQLDAFRRAFRLGVRSRSLWVSATLRTDWLATVDMRPHLGSLVPLGLSDEDRAQAEDRLHATKTLHQAPLSLDSENAKQKGGQYVEKLCDLVLDRHDATAQTLVILNNVARAQSLFRLLQKRREHNGDLLIHARFRAKERAEQTMRLRDEGVTDRIVVATQAIEAGVDLSSKLLISELAPWSSMVQRFGRCNRKGEHNEAGADVLWIDVEDDKALSRPYDVEALAAARAKLTGLGSASPLNLPPTDDERPLGAVLRRKDLLDLFNTDPDLSGFDVDISDYIRDTGAPGVQVFWREFATDPNQPGPADRPVRDELCPVSMAQISELMARKDASLWYWDALGARWEKLQRAPRPGMVLLARAADGGYDMSIGFDASIRTPPVPLIATQAPGLAEPDFSDDTRSQQKRPIALSDHLAHVAAHADRLCTAVGEICHRASVVRAGRWHDLGKLHAVFQKSMYRCRLPADPAHPLAKSDCEGSIRHERAFFRHELASMLGWLAQHDREPNADLIAYLILAHHGKVRMSLRAMPTEGEHVLPRVRRFARGVYDGDALPALDFDGEHSAATTLRLALMEMGEGEQGASWTERALRLLDQYGPFQLAWLETLVRLADWRASAAEQEGDVP